MDRTELEEVLRAFGERCDDCECIVVGGAAAILCGWLARVTGDVDVIQSRPKLSTLVREIQEVAEEFGLSESWINDGASAWKDVLPFDFEERLVFAWPPWRTEDLRSESKGFHPTQTVFPQTRGPSRRKRDESF